MTILAPVYNRDGSPRLGADGTPMIVEWQKPLIHNGNLWIKAGKLPAADKVTKTDLEELELDSPFNRLGPDQSPDDLWFTKAREVLVVTSDQKLILLQRSPWAASVGQLQSTGGGFTGVVDGRAETVAETLKTKLELKHGVSINTDDLSDLNCTTVGGGITTFKGLDKDGVMQVGGTAEILESYFVRSKLTAAEFVDQMRPAYKDVVGVAIIDLHQIGDVATERFVPASYVANSLYSFLIDPIEPVAHALPLGEVYEKLLKVWRGEMTLPPETAERGECPAHKIEPAIIDTLKLFHPRTVPVLFAVAEAMGVELPWQAKANLSAFRDTLDAQKRVLDTRAAGIAISQQRPPSEAAPEVATPE